MVVEIRGLKALNASFNNFLLDTNKAIDDVVLITAKLVKNTARLSIGEISNGEQVTRYSPERIHTVSKVGEAPNTDTRKLERSIKVDHDKGSQVAHVFTEVDYGFILETVLNRPFLEPAKEAEIKNFDALVTKTLKKQIEDAGK